VLANLIPVDQYAVLAFISTATGVLAALLILGGDTAYTRFYFNMTTEQERRDLTVTWLGFLVVWSTAIVALLLPFSGFAARWSLEGNGSAVLFVLMLVSLPIAQSSRMLAQTLRNEFRPLAYASTSFGVSLLGFTMTMLFVGRYDLGVRGVLIAYLAAETAIGLTRLVLARHSLRGTFRPHLLPDLLRFGVPLVAVSLSFWVFTMSDRVVLLKLGSHGSLAHYSLAGSVTSVLVLVSGAAASAWTPRSFVLFEDDPDRAARVIGKLLGYFLVLLGSLAVVLATAAREIVEILAPPAYLPAAKVLPLLAFGLVASGSALLTGSGIAMMRATKYAGRYAAYAALTNVVLAIVLVPSLDLRGAALASAAGYVQLTALYLWRSQRLWPIVVDWKRLAAVVLGLCACTAATSMEVVQASPFKWAIPLLFVAAAVTVGPLPLREFPAVRRSFLAR
ncbi:MAG: polysaccharide biosynthesis C-terminal domain-containing protein, partial [Mycobacteriales bacterium]